MAGHWPGRPVTVMLIPCALLTAVFAPLSTRLLRTRET